ncbi:MAG: invasin domain 3-containing protein [Gemmatimonadota bacterium]
MISPATHPPGRSALVLGCLVAVLLPVSGLRAQTATALRFVEEPTDVDVGEHIDPAVTVEAVDASGNRVASFTARIDVGLHSNPGGATLGGRKHDDAESGLATFDNLSVSKPGAGYTLEATADGLTSTTSAPFDVVDDDDEDDDDDDDDDEDDEPGPPSGATSEITADPTSIPADGSSTSTITVRLRDESGNPLPSGGNAVTLSTDSGTLGSVSDAGDGTYLATLTSPTRGGTATVTGTVDGESIDDTATVEFTAGAPSPANSMITADPASIPANGSSTSTITVLLIDPNGEPLASGGDAVTLSTTLGTLGPVSDRGNGIYTATLTSITTPGTATVTGTVNGATIDDTATVTFAAESADLGVEVSVSDDSPTVGDDVAYVVTVRNGGPVTATGVQLVHGIPPRLALTSATASKGAYDQATGVWSVGSLAPDERETLTLILTVMDEESN